MDKKLSLLFDYQRFEKNADLQSVIDSVHRSSSARKLSDDEVEFLAAAGTPEASLKRSDPWQDKNDII